MFVKQTFSEMKFGNATNLLGSGKQRGLFWKQRQLIYSSSTWATVNFLDGNCWAYFQAKGLEKLQSIHMQFWVWSNGVSGKCICCSSILSLVQFLFSFVLFYVNMIMNNYVTKENKNWAKDKIELPAIRTVLAIGHPTNKIHKDFTLPMTPQTWLHLTHGPMNTQPHKLCSFFYPIVSK